MTEKIIKKFKTGIEGAEDTDIIKITEDAINKIRETIEISDVPSEFLLRIYLINNLDKSISFALEFDDKVGDYDRIIEVEDIKLIIDSRTIFYLLETTIDYESEDVEEQGFIIKGYYK